MKPEVAAAALGLALMSGALWGQGLEPDERRQEAATPDFAADTFTGDWNGLRTWAARSGYLLEGGIRVDSFRNRGARQDGTRTITHLDLKLGLNLEEIAGWRGTTALINVINDTGRGPQADLVGGLVGVSGIEADAPPTTRLFNAWVQKRLWDDRLAVLFGLYPIDSEFFTMESASVFIQPQYGTPADLALTHEPSIFNHSALGLRVRWAIDSAAYVMAAVLDGVPNDPHHPRRTRIHLSSDDGSFQIAELGWHPEPDNKDLAGHVKLALGFWGYSRREPDLESGKAKRPIGAYVLGERKLLSLNAESSRIVTGFARWTWSEGKTTPLRNSFNLGLRVQGPMASRPQDVLGIAWTTANTASAWRAREVAVGLAEPDRRESTLELTYRLALTKALAIQPNFQFIRNPGAHAGIPNAHLLGFRFDLAL